MRRRLTGAVIAALGLLAFGAATAQAQPSLTICHGLHVTIAGETIVDDAGCNRVPPEDGEEG